MKGGEANAVLKGILENDNVSSRGMREVIREVAGRIEQRTYWYFTKDELSYLGEVYEKQVKREVLKERIRLITTQKMEDVMAEIVVGQLKKGQEQERDELEIGLGVTEFYDELPEKDERTDRCKDKVKKINEDFRSFKQKMDQIKQRQAAKKNEKATLEQEFKKSIEKEKKEQYRQQIRKHLDKLKKKQEQRKQSMDKFKQFFKEYKQTKPLHVLMEQMYHEKVELPQLEDSRRKLQALTHRKKPTLEQINDHDRSYMTKKQARPEKTFMQHHTIDVPYKSRFYQEEEDKLKEKEDEEYGSHWDFIQKQKRYSQFVKDRFKPKMSQDKRRLSQEIINAKPEYKEVPDRSRYIEVGNHYFEYMKNLQKRKAATPTRPAQLKESRYVNYLQEFKAKSDHRQKSSMSWQYDLKDRTTSQMEKRDRIIRKSRQLQEKAMMDEKFVSNYNYGRAEEIIERKREIDEVLLSSIKAKVAVLQEARKNK